MSKKRISIEVSPTTHDVVKRVSGELGCSMSEAIGAALEAFGRRSEEDQRKSLAVWTALHAFLTTMSGKKN